jgi:broad specificity phosphatase PhoE
MDMYFAGRFRYIAFWLTLMGLLIFFVTCNSTNGPESPLQEAWTTFVLVRHAEKRTDTDDPDLTLDGYARAQNLTRFLAGDALHAIYASPFLRTQRTAEPIARHLGLDIRPYDPGLLAEMADRLLTLHQGHTVLVVGHGNTTPALANLLTNQEQFSSFDESDYDSLIIVTCREDDRCTARRYFLNQI